MLVDKEKWSWSKNTNLWL